MDKFGITHDLYIQQGDDRPVTWDLAINGSPIDTSGFTARAMVRSDWDSEVILHEWSTENGKAYFEDSTVCLNVTDSDDWSWRYGRYDLLITPPDSVSQVIDRGKVFIIPLVTRDN